MTITLNGSTGINTPGVVNTAAETIATTLAVTGVTTVQAGTAALPAITTTGDTNTGIFFPAADTIGFAEGGVEAMRIDSAGNLGIGTASPLTKLYVEGLFGTSTTALTVSNSSGASASNIARIEFRSGNSYGGLERTASIDAINPNAGANNGGTLVFSTSSNGTSTTPTERVRIDSSGNLLVGTTSAGGRLCATAGSASQSPIATTSVSGDTIYQAILVTKFDNNSTTSQNFIQFQINNGGANCGKITANGANTAAFGSTSDQRVKENISELPSQLANIMALRPVEFDYLESYGGGHQIGFIAQEMQQVYPDVISTDNSPEQIMSITGWSKTESRLVKAIQEQQALITSLTDRITALENK